MGAHFIGGPHNEELSNKFRDTLRTDTDTDIDKAPYIKLGVNVNDLGQLILPALSSAVNFVHKCAHYTYSRHFQTMFSAITIE